MGSVEGALMPTAVNPAAQAFARRSVRALRAQRAVNRRLIFRLKVRYRLMQFAQLRGAICLFLLKLLGPRAV